MDQKPGTRRIIAMRSHALHDQLGHKYMNTTRIYPRLSSEDVKHDVQKILF